MIEIIVKGILLGLSITAPIGPTNIEVIRRGLKEGWKSAFVFCLGVMIALITYLVLVVFGLSFLTQSIIFNVIMLFFGVLVLLYLSYNSLKDFLDKEDFDLSGKVDSTKNFVPGIILTISNPAVLLLWTGIMGADLASMQASFEEGLVLSLGILTGVLIFFSGLTILIHLGKRYIHKKNLRYTSLIAGLILLYFTIKFGKDLIDLLLQIR
ncbi:LysE family transporter [Candidatus Micrarchaeota archaeon]|nr:LysE family transporter [Candidatus Micrarchaeota archaeon]